jgi:5'-methylthioadenosine phosphorylase
MITDYDCWHEEEEEVSGLAVMEVLKQNVSTAQDVIRRVVRRLPAERKCGCGDALANALITDRSLVPEKRLRDLEPLIGRYMPLSSE